MRSAKLLYYVLFVCFLFSAKVQCKKLQADNAFLKEQLKGGRRTRLAGGSRQAETDANRSHLVSSSSLPQDSTLAGKENEPGATGMAAVVPKKEPRKRINLLESLERELNSTEHSTPAASATQPIKPIVHPLKECPREKESSRPTTLNEGASPNDAQSTVRNEQDENEVKKASPVTCQEVPAQQVMADSAFSPDCSDFVVVTTYLDISLLE